MVLAAWPLSRRQGKQIEAEAVLRLGHKQPSWPRGENIGHTPSVVCIEFQAGQQRLVLGLGSGTTPTITLLPLTLLTAAQNRQGQSVCLQEKGGCLLRTDCFMGVQREWPKLIWENRVSSEHPGLCVSAEEDSA